MVFFTSSILTVIFIFYFLSFLSISICLILSPPFVPLFLFPLSSPPSLVKVELKLAFTTCQTYLQDRLEGIRSVRDRWSRTSPSQLASFQFQADFNISMEKFVFTRLESSTRLQLWWRHRLWKLLVGSSWRHKPLNDIHAYPMNAIESMTDVWLTLNQAKAQNTWGRFHELLWWWFSGFRIAL